MYKWIAKEKKRGNGWKWGNKCKKGLKGILWDSRFVPTAARSCLRSIRGRLRAHFGPHSTQTTTRRAVAVLAFLRRWKCMVEWKGMVWNRKGKSFLMMDRKERKCFMIKIRERKNFLKKKCIFKMINYLNGIYYLNQMKNEKR